MAMSLAKGARVTLSKVDGFADGVAVKHVSDPADPGIYLIICSCAQTTGPPHHLSTNHSSTTPVSKPLPSQPQQVGAETFRLCRQLVDGVVLVDNAAISGAIKDVFNETRSILEPAGAVAVSGDIWEGGGATCIVPSCSAPL
jgi:hypothetical protein